MGDSTKSYYFLNSYIDGVFTFRKLDNTQEFTWSGTENYLGHNVMLGHTRSFVYPNYIINSSTEGSTKKFKITIDDSGTISATEITE